MGKGNNVANGRYADNDDVISSGVGATTAGRGGLDRWLNDGRSAGRCAVAPSGE